MTKKYYMLPKKEFSELTSDQKFLCNAKYKPESKKRKVYMTEKMIKEEKERLNVEKQCHERNKFLDVNESLFNNQGDVI